MTLANRRILHYSMQLTESIKELTETVNQREKALRLKECRSWLTSLERELSDRENALPSEEIARRKKLAKSFPPDCRTE